MKKIPQNKRIRQILPALYLTVLTFALTAAAAAQEIWHDDARRADSYYQAADYNAAWLFYERALAAGCSDGRILLRAAESFEQQNLTENPELGIRLYAVAAHYLAQQYPEDPYAAYASPGTNRQYIRKTYAGLGGKMPRQPFLRNLRGSVKAFISVRSEESRMLFRIFRTDGFAAALNWAKDRVWSLILTFLTVSLMTGIILPLVMAAAVAREGRKSYVTAYALLLHWGALGIHRFYLGRKTSGFIWLFTGGLLGIGVFFDIFLTGAYVRFFNEEHRRPFSPPVSGTLSAPRTGTKRPPQKKAARGLLARARQEAESRPVASANTYAEPADSSDDLFDTSFDIPDERNDSGTF